MRFTSIVIITILFGFSGSFAQTTEPSNGGGFRGGGGGFGRGGQPPAVPLKPTTQAAIHGGTLHNVTLCGALGDGKTLDSDAINQAIDDAAADGGGTVYFPAGVYLSYAIHLKSNITLQLDAGARILAAAPGIDGRSYDPAEPNPAGGTYQDGGHSHWHDGLIWGDGLENIAIVGPGIIDGTGLSTGDFGGARGGRGAGFGPGRGGGFGPGGGGRRGGGGGDTGFTEASTTEPTDLSASPATQSTSQPTTRGPLQGNKALALKLCRNVTVRDVSFYRGGHICLLATGCDNMTVANVKFDTDRDSFDIDACRNMRVSDCSINSPNDDGLVLKSTFALGYARACENITITNCLLCGYEIGSLLDATYKPLNRRVPDGYGPTGRIKLGTESIGGFRNITISNCVFDHSRGLALETVDGAPIEDISISNLTMRDTSNSPIFLRLGQRMRAPAGTAVGVMRRVSISNVVVSNAEPKYACIIAGIPNALIEDVKLSNIRIDYQGGGTKEQADINPPEAINGYPEPGALGTMPAYGFFIRHVKNLQASDIDLSYAKDDLRPPFVLQDVQGATFRGIKAMRADDTPGFVLSDVSGFDLLQSNLSVTTR